MAHDKARFDPLDSRSAQEVCRILTVYRRYDRTPSAQAKRRPQRANQLLQSERNRRLVELLDSAGYLPIRGLRILDVGCGSGGMLAYMRELGADERNLFGVDLLPERIAAATAALPQATLYADNGEALRFGSESFDLVLLFTVMSSILDDAMARGLASEVARVLRLGGSVVWYDTRLPNPFNRNTRPFHLQHITELFPGFRIHVEPITLLPPLARHLGVLIGPLYRSLSRVRILRSHYIGLLTKKRLSS